MSTAPNFDGIARLYRWLEYLTLGPTLEQTRFCLLERLRPCRRALILGDGDGRFTERLLQAQQSLVADAVDASAVMLQLLRIRCVPHARRLKTQQADVREIVFTGRYDLIVTHFFLDCLTDDELAVLVARLQAHSEPDTLWLVSEFAVPPNLLHWPARLYVRLLYFAFRVLTGLRITRLPDYHRVLRDAGFSVVERQTRLFGLLVSEVWRSFHTNEVDGSGAANYNVTRL
jgi:SAM-dependent methyltransferase